MTTIAAPALEAELSTRRRVAIAAASLAGAAAAAATAVNVGSDPVEPDAWSLVRGLLVVSYVAAGVYTWWRRPSSLFGLMLAQLGLLYALSSLSASNVESVHSVGRVSHAAYVVGLAYVFLCFPRDSLATQLERRLVGVLAASTAVVWLTAVPVVEVLPAGGPLIACGGACPENAFRLLTVPPSVSDALNLSVNVVTALCLLAVAAVLYGKARSPGLLRRRLVVPLFLSLVVLTLSYAAFTVLRELELGGTDVLRGIGAASAVAIPVALIVGQVRGRVFAAARLGDLVTRTSDEKVTPRVVQLLLRDALGDPRLTLVLRHDHVGWVDVDGRPADLPAASADVAITHVRRDGRSIAALAHDPALDAGAGVTEGLAATALMLLENAQLVDELRASRARIVESAQRERLRLERNLHDGAQQRLFAIQLKVAAARTRVTDEELGLELDEIAGDAEAAVEELRSLAHGLYPAILRERGLADALRAYAQTSVVPVDVVARGVPRASATVEEAVYFCVLEAVQNVVKHAGQGAHAVVTLERIGPELAFSVADDGRGLGDGGAGGGLGLMGMRDRIGAVGGKVEIAARSGGGSVVRGTIPSCWAADAPER
jgi:signal transduction histidine kinase